MEVGHIQIHDAALSRLSGKDLNDLIDEEFDRVKEDFKRNVNAARKQMGKEVLTDGEGEKQLSEHEPGNPQV